MLYFILFFYAIIHENPKKNTACGRLDYIIRFFLDILRLYNPKILNFFGLCRFTKG